jgi:hypothetical protein
MIALVVFCMSVPVMSSVDKIIFFARGYDRELVLEKDDTYSKRGMAEKYYDAFRKESRSIMFWTRLIAWFWFAMLVFSIIVIIDRVSIPFKLQYIAAAACLILLVVTILPVLIFGRSWPGRPF